MQVAEQIVNAKSNGISRNAQHHNHVRAEEVMMMGAFGSSVDESVAEILGSSNYKTHLAWSYTVR